MVLLSMMMLASAQDRDPVESAMARSRTMTRAELPCVAPADDDEILVCANRNSDRYRIPLVSAVSTRDLEPRTPALLDSHAPACGQGAFTVRCGKAGVSVTRTFGGGTGSGEVSVDTERDKTR